MAYSSFLIKVGNYNIDLDYIRHETYKVTKTIIDLDPYRDANGLLHRNALSHVPYKIEFNTIGMMTSTQASEFLSNIQKNFTVAQERRASVTFFCPETDDYITQDMYMADPQITIWGKKNGKLLYEEIRIAFIGY